MQPYYSHGGIAIFNCDARNALDVRGHVVVSDPPYGIDGGRGGGNRQRGKGNYLFESGWRDDEENILNVVIPVFDHLVKTIGRVVITPGTRQMHHYMKLLPPPADIGCFFHPAALGFGSWGMAAFNPILYYGRDPRAGIGQVASGIRVTESAPKGVDHPCPKPYKAWKWLVAKASREHETVIDPFMGSGTTLLVAKHLGLNAIGIEIEERYCEIAAERLSQEVMDI